MPRVARRPLLLLLGLRSGLVEVQRDDARRHGVDPGRHRPRPFHGQLFARHRRLEVAMGAGDDSFADDRPRALESASAGPLSPAPDPQADAPAAAPPARSGAGPIPPARTKVGHLSRSRWASEAAAPS